MKKYVSLGIMLSLISGKKLTASYLADKYETSIKTIYRSIETLLEAGMPIKCIQGKNGGYQLIEGSSINNSIFTIKELSAFISFLKTSNKILNKNISPIEEKISNSFDKNILKEIDEESNNLIIDLTMWGNSENNSLLINELEDCIANKKVIEIKYTNLHKNIIEKRIIHPYSLVFKITTWYLYAYCEQKKDFRLFKLSRIKQLKYQFRQFEKLQIDLLSKPWNKDFKENLEKINIKLKCPSIYINDILDWLGNDCVINYSTDKTTAIISGSAHYSLGLAHKIIEYGTNIQIIEPQKLKDTIISECTHICENYK